MSHVLVTTKHRGVFFGKLKEDKGATVILEQARNCVSWDQATRGFLGLATTGPTSGCRIGPAAPELTLYGVTSIATCSDEAVKAWERAPWI